MFFEFELRAYEPLLECLFVFVVDVFDVTQCKRIFATLYLTFVIGNIECPRLGEHFIMFNL